VNRILISTFILGVTVPLAGHAQSSQKPVAFEVATLKRNLARDVGVSGGCRGNDSRLAAADPRGNVPLGRCVITGARLSHLIAIAFGTPMNRISGLPPWDNDVRFDVQAKAEEPATTTELQLLSMLQRFIADEFNASTHRDVKEVPAFALMVAKKGPKNLRPSKEAACLMPPPPQAVGLVFIGCSMRDVAAFLSTAPTIQRPVADKTGLTGRFDILVEVGSRPRDVAEWKAAMMGWESITSDIEDQLGLRFERTTGSIEQLVIDRIQRPALD
jgi:uncharacterized protein (TIGR03435 family)